jgi:hypothetical protein
MKHAGAEMQRRLNVHRQPGRAIEVGEARQRRQRQRALIAREVQSMQPSIRSNPAPPPRQSQRFGQAAGFIQFDIDHLIAPAQRAALPGMAALVGANRQRMNKIFQRRIGVGRSGCSSIATPRSASS